MAKPKVFVLTDDQAAVAAVRSSIESECEVFVAAWDRTAVVQIHEQAPLVVLLDLGSSSDPVVEERVRVLQEVRQTGHAGKVIACTERTERRLAVRAIQYGAYDVLSKPLD
ncbi:MAG: response regulator, partial [Nitrospira sp.]|nr:response regulator [Nitrospira sp.]